MPGDCSARGTEEGEAAGYCYERENGELGLEELPRGERRDTVLRGARGMGEVAGHGIERAHEEFGLESCCRRASAAILFCTGEQRRARQEIAF